MSVTNHSTIEAAIRELGRSCSFGEPGKNVFLENTFISDMASMVQRQEQAAFDRGVAAAKMSDQQKLRTHAPFTPTK